MTAPYPTPATPLPWTMPDIKGTGDNTTDAVYLVRAANAFPHLVAALETIARDWPEFTDIEQALAIARGEAAP